MANELAVRSGNWLQLKDSFGDEIRPFRREIFLKECAVDGVLEINDALFLVEDLAIGETVGVRRFPKERGAHTVAFVVKGGERFGYVPKADREIIANLMDAGKKIMGKIVSKSVDGHWLNMRVGLYLEDV